MGAAGETFRSADAVTGAGSERRGLIAVFSFDAPKPNPDVFVMRDAFETTSAPAPGLVEVMLLPSIGVGRMRGFLTTAGEVRGAVPGAVWRRGMGVFAVDVRETLGVTLTGVLLIALMGSGFDTGVP